MNNELVKYSRGEVAVPRHDREIARRGKAVYDRARLQATKADASLALAGHIMHGVTELDKLRRELAGDNTALDLALSEIEHNAIVQVQRVQSGLHNDWNF